MNNQGLKKHLWTLLGVPTVLAMALAGCTGGALKKKAEADGKDMFVRAVQLETQEVLPAEHELAGTFATYIERKTEISIGEIKESAQSAEVQVFYKSVPAKNRRVLAEIAAKQLGAKASKFNMGNAAQLIEAQDGMVRGLEDGEFKIRYVKVGDSWSFDKLLKEPPQPVE